MASYLLGVKVPFSWWLCLASSIWIIYTTDHLIDALKIEKPVDTRRKFYTQYFLSLRSIVITLLIITVLISFLFLDKQVIMFGITLGLLSGIYLLLVFTFGNQKRILLQKEFIVAIIYTVGIWGSLIIKSSNFPIIEVSVVILSFFLLVYADILIFSFFDFDLDKKYDFVSLIGTIGQRKTIVLIYNMLSIATILSITLIFSDLKAIQFCAILLFSMTSILLLMFKFRERFAKNERYRYLGEAIFFLPGFIVLI